MAKILVMLITGKENINNEMVAFNFAVNAVRNAKATVEFMFLGRGAQAANKRQKSSPQFMEQVESLSIPDTLFYSIAPCKIMTMWINDNAETEKR